MALFDFIIILLILLAFIYGYLKGIVKIFLSIIAILLSIYISIYYSKYFINFFIETFKFSEIFSRFISFILIFITVLLIFKIISFIIDSIISNTNLNNFNKVMGGIFNVFKLLLLISILITYTFEINKKHKLFNNKIFEESFLCKKLIFVGEKIINLDEKSKIDLKHRKEKIKILTIKFCK